MGFTSSTWFLDSLSLQLQLPTKLFATRQRVRAAEKSVCASERVYLHVAYVQLSVCCILKCQPSLCPELCESAASVPLVGQTDEYVLFDIWQTSALTDQLDSVIFSSPSELSAEPHKGASVSVGDAFILSTQF